MDKFILDTLYEIQTNFDVNAFATLDNKCWWIGVDDYDIYQSPHFKAFCQEKQMVNKDECDDRKISFCYWVLTQKMKKEMIEKENYIEVSK